MTTPETFTESAYAMERTRWRLSQSVEIYERGQEAIRQTRLLLMDVTRDSLAHKAGSE